MSIHSGRHPLQDCEWVPKECTKKRHQTIKWHVWLSMVDDCKMQTRIYCETAGSTGTWWQCIYLMRYQTLFYVRSVIQRQQWDWNAMWNTEKCVCEFVWYVISIRLAWVSLRGQEVCLSPKLFLYALPSPPVSFHAPSLDRFHFSWLQRTPDFPWKASTVLLIPTQ